MIGPAVSVVVPTRDRRHRLARLVGALEAQHDAPPFELVIVDDASTDDTMAELRSLARTASFPLTALRLERNAGPATARNAGWRRARAPLVVFTDDDCAPQPGWLASLVGALERADVVQGRTLPDPAQGDGQPFSYSITVEGEWGYYEGCNIAYRRALLEELGGFEERFHYDRDVPPGVGPIYGEDVDLAWRAKKAAARIVFEPDALVLHDVRRRSFADHLRDLRRREGIVLAVTANPLLRERCYFHVFWARSHPSALVAAIGVALAAGSRTRPARAAGAALVVPYVRHRTRVMPVGRRRQWPLTIPLSLVADLAEIGVFARASWRYRTLVL